MATIRDIAEACGVCTSVVSYVINNTRTVAPKTREKVLLAMREMNYQPSAVARGLSSKRMNSVGVVFSRIHSSPLSNPFFGPILDSIVSTDMDRQQSTTLFTWPTWEEITAHHAVFCDGRCDGIILLAPDPKSNVISVLQGRGARFIVVGHTVDVKDVASIDINNREAARVAVRHLTDLGHRRVAFVSGDIWAAGAGERLEGYRQALGEADIEYDDDLVCLASYNVGTVPAQIARLCAYPEGKRPTAIFFGNDEMAIAGIAELRKYGLEVPDDISVVGFDDIASAASSTPALTTVRQPLSAFGRSAVTTLLGFIDGTATDRKHIELAAELIVRRSTRPHR